MANAINMVTVEPLLHAHTPSFATVAWYFLHQQSKRRENPLGLPAAELRRVVCAFRRSSVTRWSAQIRFVGLLPTTFEKHRRLCLSVCV